METPLPIHRATPTREAGRTGSAMRRRTKHPGPDRLVRVGPNAFVRAVDWEAAGPRARYVTRVWARLARLGEPAVASHVSAAALHGLASLYGWPEQVHVTLPKSRYRSASNGLVLHTRPFGAEDVARDGPLAATSIPRTVVDVALAGDVRAGVVLADSALRGGTPVAALDAALRSSPRGRGRRAAELVLEIADARSGSAAESLARVVFRELGLPEPVLQQVFVVDGRRMFVDFWFPEQGVVVEIDGRAKYSQPRYLGGRSPTEAFVDEKRRQEALLTVPDVRRVVRVEWADLHAPGPLAHRLRAAGLPCAVRPGPSARLVLP
ncbi:MULTISPECIES: hypothetical protein [unclassified Curtobacterium]|uniref:hypothetical protein n=1 Tax=unclassified Curtobacterium TaxID=257496 RepID=UPI0037F42CB9